MSAININALKAQIEAEASSLDSSAKLEEFRIKYLGRKGILAELTASIPGLPKEERGAFGQQVNLLKNQINGLIEKKHFGAADLTARVNVARPEQADIALPGIAQDLGQLHPITQIIDEVCAIFTRMGFSVVEGPEIESEYNNFTGLNIPLDHPSRDAFDTFYLKGNNKLLLRSHTSPVQVRVMKKQKPPVAVVVPGRVYRPDATDASHLFMFHQIEGFMVDKGIKFSDLKGMLELFVKAVFGKEIKMRLRPHFFPFTEPSAEVDISCTICKGSGCPSCGKKGWLEILGSGMIHPNVLKNVGYNPKIYSGFAFGMGIERIANLKYGVKDIRMFFENDLRMLKQF
jgi:phenylalanyl-tRNA synthetase alpha chain